jgi:hypothetical protein
MNHCWVEIEVSYFKKTKLKKLNALADTGTTLTVLPEEIAREIGIEAKEEDTVETGAGCKGEKGNGMDQDWKKGGSIQRLGVQCN